MSDWTDYGECYRIQSEAQWKPVAEDAIASSNYGEQKLHLVSFTRKY